jgi:hypothetical protein
MSLTISDSPGSDRSSGDDGEGDAEGRLPREAAGAFSCLDTIQIALQWQLWYEVVG